jgi:hypothetical protein
VEWPYPFSSIEHPQDKRALEAELTRELKPGHPLFGLWAAAIGRRHDQDDVVFELLDGSNRIAEVHLTWSGNNEKPPWPGTTLFENFPAWVEAVKAEHA